MAQPQMIQVKLSRFDAQPWGFRLQGGTDFAAPLLVQKVNAGSLAEQAGLMPGDAVLTINDVDVFNLRHKDAQDVVVRSGNNFVITVQRGGSTWRPHVTPTGNVPQPNTSPYLQTVTKTSLQHKQQDVQHIGSGYNNSARPFTNGGDGSVKSIVNKQYNTPVGIYSDESIAETLSAQAEVLAGGVLGVNFKKNEKEYQAEKSEVLKFLREEETGGHSTPEPHNPANFYWTQSHAIGGNERRPEQHEQQRQQRATQLQQQQQQQQQQEEQRRQQEAPKPAAPAPAAAPESADPRIIMMPVCPALQGPEYKAEMAAAAAALASDDTPRPLSASGHPACQLCGVGIVGVFVRIKDKNLHVECFKCATCGTSLKNQGYYNFNNKLYCDIHAKLAAMQNPPSGTEGYVPVPIKPNTKLSANTISSALSAHGFNGMGGQNGNSTPTPSSQTLDDTTDLPLPPPPSPTQLQQFEAEAYHKSISAAPPNNGYTRTPSSLSSGSCGSSMSPTPASGIGGLDMATSSTLSLDRFGSSPLHSRQTSSSASSSIGGMDSYSGAGGSPLPPPPPPPLPEPTTKSLNNQSNMKMQQQQQQQHGGKQNENDMNTQNKAGAATHNAYNKFLKEYSNKLLTQSNNNNNSNNDHTLDSPGNTNRTHNSHSNNNTINKITTLSNNTIPKPFKVNPNIAPNVAAVSAVLANQLKFNPHQVANPTATATAPPPLPQTATPKLPTSDSSTLLASSSCDSNLNVDSQFVPPPPPPPIASATTMMTTDELQPIYGQIGAPANPGQSAAAGQADQPFEYVTLTGNVIRSVVPPGKGVNLNYKVNQGGYARPFNAGPPAAAPKSPVSYPPQQQQQQQWGAPQPSPKPAGNPYATLPRTNAGPQDVSAASPLHNSNATLPRKPHAAAAKPVVAAYHPQTDLQPQDDATAMLTESIGKINMGNKMDNFMAEAGKIISNMLEARLANGAPATAPASSSGSTLSLRSNSSSNLSHSPMVVRKRFDLDDFKDLDPTDPVSLKPVVAVQQQVSLAPKAPPQATKAAATLPLEVVPNHPMGKVLDLCDSNQKRHIVQQAIRPAGGKLGTLKPPVSPPSTALAKPVAQFENKYAQEESLPQMETVVYRNEIDSVKRRPSRELQNSTHAIDRRSYIEPNANNSVQANATTTNANTSNTTTSTTTEDSINERPPFSVNVRALGPKADPNAPMSPENEEVVSQLLKDGKRPICCQCNKEITKGPFITALGRIWCPDHFHCVNGNCRRPLQDIGFVEEKGDLYCEYCFEKYLAPTCSKCAGKIKGDCLNAIGKHFHPECFTCGHCGKLFGNTPFFLEDGNAYCEADWNELFTTKCYACGFPVEAGDRWVEALNHNYHSQCFNCTYCKQNLEGQSFYNKGGRPFCKNHAR